MDQDKRNPPGLPPRLGPAALAIRLGAIGLATLCLAGAFAYTGGWLTPERLSPHRVVDGFEATSGRHIGFRRNHAKGVCATGWFDASGDGAPFSRADLLKPGHYPVTGRFAFAGGMPYVSDGPALVRSLALQIKPPGGEEWRMAMIDIPVFPVADADTFYAQMMTRVPDPRTGKPDPEKMKAFAAAHPEVLTAMGIVGKRRQSSGFANTTYNGLNTFLFVNRDGASAPVRWSFVPEQAFAPVGPQQADKNYLLDALIADAARPLKWKVIVTIGNPDDPVRPDLPWPEGRKQVDIGTVTLDTLASEDSAGGSCTDITFDPTVLPAGIRVSADGIPSARSAAYARSFQLREHERGAKPPSAITESDVKAGGKS
ncbi:catalase family peroxidase [Cupriavidus pauculus]|uniref:Catalase-related peroxidase n=1 Tax=Cupriavidus pauculus TaxID=82633 RepID=A0A5P2H352_9BURK|nr:catalase family peroxidase [Cupriavidus pauculus]QET02148.1 catalase family peroxidase [Cupriavidus pauculus]